MTNQESSLLPAIRVAPPRELNAYVVFEQQLDLLAQGSPSSLFLNFSLFFLGVAATSFGTLVSIPGTSDRAYYTFLIVFLVTLIAGAVLLVLWQRTHTSASRLIEEINRRAA
jgi:hypothetical protein